MQNPLIILGSSRSKGYTFDAVKLITKKLNNHSYIDLADYSINDFDYEYKNKDDDFKIILNKLLNHKTIILATPVYWYTMSASIKRFVDRISDLLSTDKEQGRLLRGKDLAVISSYSVHPEGKDGFETIFINTARYLGMNYLASYFYYSGKDPAIFKMINEIMINFIRKVYDTPFIKWLIFSSSHAMLHMK
jgi:multimeric flavodoxin WrbA